ncbi:MAG: DUF58 domain-containing protein, partial [Myxococcales bacterium]|nr:DUF58 domain-containing protein [Myxococcales bacterium]
GRSNRLFPRKLKLTREGKYVLLITFGVGFGAINSGNNLLYLTLGLLLSLIMISGILSEIALRHVEVERQFPRELHAQQGALVAVTVRNRKRYFSSFSIEIEEMFTRDIPASPCYLLHLSPLEERTTYYTVEFPHRGRYASEGFRISTRFPFSFFKKSRNIYESLEFVVFPELVAVKRPVIPMDSRRLGRNERQRIGPGDEYYGLREFRQGDEPNRIHWKVSARRGTRMVREFQRDTSNQVVLVLRNFYDEFASFSMADVEQAISVTASLARKLVNQGFQVGLHTLDAALQPAVGRRQLIQIYRHLADLAIRGGDDTPVVTGPEPRMRAIRVEPQPGGVRVATSTA